MKIFAILICLFLSVNALAQSKDTARKDTAKHFRLVEARPISKHDKFLAVIDDKPYYRSSFKRRGLRDTSNILDVEIIKGNEAVDKYGKLAGNGVVVIITRKYAVKSYQNKLSTFSKTYKSYLETHKNNDDDCAYILNGNLVTGKDKREIIKNLYLIPVEKIKTVDFVEKFSPALNANNPKPIVVITTTGKDDKLRD